MEKSRESVKEAPANPGRFRLSGWVACFAAVISFAAGALITSRLMHVRQVRADNNRVFELMIYHTLPGKAPALESIFRDVSKLQAKHGLNAMGYWVPEGDDPDWKNTFVYLVVHSDQRSADMNWKALHADAAFQPYFKAAAPLIQQVNGDYRVDEVYMRPTDFSASK